jgi:hypothetical protein
MGSQLESMWLRDVKKGLTTPEADTLVSSGEYGATFEALGLYSSSQFVVRLSMKVHELVDALGVRDLENCDPDEIFSAYSTFLHETIHNAATGIMPHGLRWELVSEASAMRLAA